MQLKALSQAAFPEGESWLKRIFRVILGTFLVFAGIGHLTFSRAEFQAQVPVWLPLDADFVVAASGAVEIALGLSLLFGGPFIPGAGAATALFFVAIFPGNLNQYFEGIDAFGLDTDQARLTRLFFQPVLVIWALWATSALEIIRPGRKSGESKG